MQYFQHCGLRLLVLQALRQHLDAQQSQLQGGALLHQLLLLPPQQRVLLLLQHHLLHLRPQLPVLCSELLVAGQAGVDPVEHAVDLVQVVVAAVRKGQAVMQGGVPFAAFEDLLPPDWRGSALAALQERLVLTHITI